ncbi:hypothetical protein RN001_015341 [Aquatica leii]|uniref:Cilia- and flagella-associated protein 91 n=1 Tax=Aquatica leii TaxID=1421715 RepID=A0AAN7NYY5_9COLE|nr:hypothetical protein RN001_015341 [Aquatica leii]
MHKVGVNRPNDYFYDPLFIVSSEKDYYKAAIAAKLSSAKYAICPIFPTMFSDLSHRPRQEVVMRESSSIPKYTEKQPQSELPQTHKTMDINGTDRYKFFSKPLHTPKKLPVVDIQYPLVVQFNAKTSKRKLNKMIQTQYRESSAQTIPWEPENYVIMDDSDPELLMLDFLKWGSGLPCGMHETKLIERARMKRAWEKSLPPITDAKTLEYRRLYLDAVARDEWAFREQEIKDIHDLRMELLIQMINETHKKSKTRIEEKLKSYCKAKLAEKEVKLKKLRHNSDREMRKLEMKRHGVRRSYGPVDVIEEHFNKKSELYAPLMRHGENPKRWHQVIDDHMQIYRAQFLGVEDICTLPSWLDKATMISHSSIKLPGTRLCIKETKWTSPVLKQLHEELKCLRKKEKHHCTLLVKVERRRSESVTPQVDAGDDFEESMHQASILVESFLRGRASQVLIYEGRDRCRELIMELRGTHALQEQEKEKLFYERLEVKSQQREYTKLASNVVGTLLDFLNKELRRLIDERKIHAMCLMFERERHFREAAEAGRRQAELRRRLEHDEMFKQVVKVNQDTIDLYLEDIITEGMDFTSQLEASLFVKKLAKSIDKKTYATHKTQKYAEKEELVANLVHNFLLPEVEKQMLRDRIKQKQQIYLKTVHDSIYDYCETLPKAEPKHYLQRAVCINTFADLSTAESQVYVESSSESRVNIIFSATKAGFKDFEVMSNIHPAMEPLLDKEDTVSTISTSTAIPIKVVETNLNIQTLEAPLGVSDEILFINLNPRKNLH